MAAADAPDEDDPSAERPAVRALDVQRATDGDGDGIVLGDRIGLSEPVFVPTGLLPIVGRCDGTRTLAQIAAEAGRQVGEPVPVAFVRDLVRQLDERLLLLGPRLDAALERAAAEFLALPARPARHAGSAGYPAEPVALRTALDALVPIAGPPAADVRGLVAPHIDLARGDAGYRAAYGCLAAALPADLYVVFGTGHAGPQAPVTGLPLDWHTPLGVVPTDRAFVAAVHARVGAPLAADLLQHRDEHSLEFQVLLLLHLHQRRGLPPPTVAAFLCGSLPSVAGDPLQEPWCRELLAAFRAAARARGGRICYLAGADLAHIGPRFGDADAVDRARLERLAAADLGYLAPLQRGEPGGFHRAIERDGNRDRICSAPAITLCAALAGGSARLLHYGQACADDGAQTVSFTALAFQP